MKYIIFFLSLTTLYSADLYLQNVKPIIKEILNQHVEFKEITPLIMKRAFRLYIYRFDPQQTYLTTEEIKPFLTRSEEEWNQVTQRFLKEDYSDFRLLQETIFNATLRAQDWRKSIKKCLIETPMNQLISYSKEKQKSIKEVFDKNESDCVLWFVDYCNEQKLEDPTREEKEKALHFYEKIKLRKEEVYLSTSDKDFSCQILKSVIASLDAHSAF
ncbi:MAG: hypothetical protein FJZ56_04335, partial [Chlamydiae bacterium]|nr:hypothetical protein [Chlamydiota bacterium]